MRIIPACLLLIFTATAVAADTQPATQPKQEAWLLKMMDAITPEMIPAADDSKIVTLEKREKIGNLLRVGQTSSSVVVKFADISEPAPTAPLRARFTASGINTHGVKWNLTVEDDLNEQVRPSSELAQAKANEKERIAAAKILQPGQWYKLTGKSGYSSVGIGAKSVGLYVHFKMVRPVPVPTTQPAK